MIHEVLLPEISETVESGDVIDIFVKKGDSVDLEQPLVQLETEKATFDVPSPVKGQIVEILIKQGQKVNVGQLLFKVETSADNTTTTSGRPKQPKAETKQTEGENSVAVQKDVGTVPASQVRQRPEEPEPGAGLNAGADSDGRVGRPMAEKPLPDFSVWGPVERKAVSTTRKKIAAALSYTWATVPQVTQYDHADVTLLEEFRKDCSPRVNDAGGKLTLTSIVLKAVALTLHDFPQFNASFDPTTDEIVYKKYCHLSVAVDTDRGLLVPVLRDVDKKSLLQVAVELTSLAERTKQHKVTPEEMGGGCFTVSNLGGLCGGAFAPIIYWPQAAILGIARASQKPVVIEDSIQPRLIVPLSLSYDHRIVDGADGVRFLRRVVEILENPFLLALE